jgi:hypothetical protein
MKYKSVGHFLALLLYLSLWMSTIMNTPTLGKEVTSQNIEHNIIDADQDSQSKPEIMHYHMQLTSRFLHESDETCDNACDDESMSRFQASFRFDEIESANDDKMTSSNNTGSERFFGRMVGFFRNSKDIFRRWMNGLRIIFNRNTDDDPKFLISTKKTYPLLSNYSTKFRSLAVLIRIESANAAVLSKTPDAIRMLYNISAENMEVVATVLDPILDNMRQQDAMDIKDISCNMMQILFVLRDTAIPIIKTTTQFIFAKSNNAAMIDRFNDYTKSSESSVVETAVTSSEDITCAHVSSPTKSCFSAIFGDCGDILDALLSDDYIVSGPIEHIAVIILAIVAFPIAIVGSIIPTIILILVLTVNYIMVLFGGDNSLNDGFEQLFLFVFLGSFAVAPLYVAFILFRNVLGFFRAILDPFLPDRPTLEPTPAPISAPSPPTFFQIDLPASTEYAQQASDVIYRLSEVLDSPLETTLTVFQNENAFLDARKGDEDEVDCEMATLKCKNDALIDVLPF